MGNVHHFGAVGDGQADDSTALEHALEAGDGILKLGKGTYRITRPLVNDLTKQGYGAVLGEGGASRIVMEGSGPAIRMIGDHQGTAQPSTYQAHTWEKERFPTIQDVEVLGRHPEAVGIELRKTTKTVISRVLVRECLHGIQLVERNRDFILSDSHLLHNHAYGLFFDRCNLHQIIVHGNHISWNKKAGIRTTDGDVHNLQITGNDIEYNNHPGVDESPGGEPTGAEIWFEATAGVISEVTIASNTIQATVQPGGANIRIWGSPDAEMESNRLIAITGNVLGSQERGIELRHGKRITVSGNTIYDSRDLSILMEDCSGFAIGANTFVWRSDNDAPLQDGLKFVRCQSGTLTGLQAEHLCYGTQQRGGGITLEQCRDITIGHCQVLDPEIRGIELVDCVRCRVSSNSIVDRRQPPRMLEAVRLTGNGRDNLIDNNMVGGARRRAIEVAEGGAVVRDNVEVQGAD